MSNNAVLSALRRMDISGDEMTGHGFRATARTIGAECWGFAPISWSISLHGKNHWGAHTTEHHFCLSAAI